ncbi:MAG: agmatine deiminase family protein [Saprospiraceae bacterium]|nr:agmatine deiminase family protein [Saprospiraceae bacterium]
MFRRLPAEWEAQSAIQFTFPHEDSDWLPMLDEVVPCFVRLIEAASQYQKVLVVCKDKEKTAELLRGAVQERLWLVELPSNDTWARDHAAITVFDDEKPVLLDFVFNGWGLKFAADKDNLITQRLFDKGIFKAKKLQKGGLVLEGGGIESDGKGTLMTTAECLLSPNRNPHLSKKQIEQRLKRLFGVERILWLNHGYLAGDDTDSHIDTLARFCDEHTIAYVQCLDPNDEHFVALQNMENELRAFRRVDGQPYKLIPLPMSEAIYDEEGLRLPATYANFTIINGAVLVPTYGVPQDTLALDILRGCFPDRKVIGLDCCPLIYQHGSLHCVTMQFPEGTI